MPKDLIPMSPRTPWRLFFVNSKVSDYNGNVDKKLLLQQN